MCHKALYVITSLEFSSSMFSTWQRFYNPKPLNFTWHASNALSASERIRIPVISGIKHDLNVSQIGSK